MAKCEATIQEMRFDISDPNATHVYILVKATGICPPHIAGWHHKDFPIHIPIIEIFANFIDDYLRWEIQSPPVSAEKVP